MRTFVKYENGYAIPLRQYVNASELAVMFDISNEEVEEIINNRLAVYNVTPTAIMFPIDIITLRAVSIIQQKRKNK